MFRFIKKIFLVILILFLENTFAQSVNKLMQSIKNYDYYHTRMYAYKMLKNKKKIPAGAYALAYVYYQDFKPFQNLDSADKFIHLAIINYKKPYITKYGTIDSSAIYALYDSITNTQFLKMKHNALPSAYDVFISHHPFMSKKLREKIKMHQYQKILEYVQNINKSDTTLEYMAKYPEHPQMALLQQLLDKQIFLENTAHHTAAEYLLFLRSFPNNQNRDKALQNLLDIYIKEKNIVGLKSFVKEFSKDRYYSEQAWKWLFVYSVKKINNEELEKFMKENPDFPFKKEILEEMAMNNKSLIPYSDTTGLVGFIDTLGQFAIPPLYDAVTPFKENTSVVVKEDSVFFINKNGQKLFTQTFKDAYAFYNGFAPVFDGTHWYFINRLGVKQSGEFDWISERSNDNNYIFKKGNLYGLCDYKGDIILPAKFEKLGDFENHKSYYTENNLYGIVWDDGKQYPAQYQWISVFYNDVAIVKQNNLYGIVSAKNEVILNIQYDLIFHVTNDIYVVVKNKQYGFYSATQQCFIYNIQWDYNTQYNLKTFSDGKLFKLVRQNKVFIGNNNGVILNKKYFQDVVIYNDCVFAKSNKKWGIVNMQNISNFNTFQYLNLSYCDNHSIIAQTTKGYFILDLQEKILYSSENKINYIVKNYYFEEAENAGKIIDIYGKIILDNVEEYKVFEKYLIVIRTDKNITVVR